MAILPSEPILGLTVSLEPYYEFQTDANLLLGFFSVTLKVADYKAEDEPVEVLEVGRTGSVGVVKLEQQGVGEFRLGVLGT